MVSVQNEFVYANTAAVDLYEVPNTSSLVGRQVREFIHPDYRDDIDRQLQRIESGERPTDHIRRTLLTLEGTEVSVEVTARHVVWNGSPGVVAIVRDLSRQEARIRKQERYEPSFKQAFESMVIADDDGRYIEANQSACELFGLEKQQLLGRSIEEITPEGYDREAAWPQFGETSIARGPFPMVRDDGKKRVVEFATTANIISGEHLSVLRDVTN